MRLLIIIIFLIARYSALSHCRVQVRFAMPGKIGAVEGGLPVETVFKTIWTLSTQYTRSPVRLDENPTDELAVLQARMAPWLCWSCNVDCFESQRNAQIGGPKSNERTIFRE